MTKKTEPSIMLTSSALEAISQRFPEDQIKIIYIKLIRKPEARNIIKVQLLDNTYWELQQKWTGKPAWQQMFV